MKAIRVIWKDTNTKRYKPVKYRGHMIYGSSKGWTNDFVDDHNVYATHYDALNSIDARLGGGNAGNKRRNYGTNVVGTL